jgi:hypothetical protein
VCSPVSVTIASGRWVLCCRGAGIHAVNSAPLAPILRKALAFKQLLYSRFRVDIQQHIIGLVMHTVLHTMPCWLLTSRT